MDRDGSNCFAGVRYIAGISGYDKTTVANHRDLAIKLGWLMESPHSRYSPRRFVFPSVPDNFRIASEGELSGGTGQSLSGAAGQSSEALSGLTSGTVRPEASDCPVGTDIPLIPVLPLKASGVGNRERHLELLKRQTSLLTWVLRDETAKKYGDSPYALVLLAPPALRFRGYEEFLEGVGGPHLRPPPATGGGG